jgi:hypothetical protein
LRTSSLGFGQIEMVRPASTTAANPKTLVDDGHPPTRAGKRSGAPTVDGIEGGSLVAGTCWRKGSEPSARFRGLTALPPK